MEFKRNKQHLERLLESKKKKEGEKFAHLIESLEVLLQKRQSGRFLKKTAFNEALPSEIKPIYLGVITAGLALIAFNLSQIFRVSFGFLMTLFSLSELSILLYMLKKRKNVKDLLEENLAEILETIARVYRVYPDLKTALLEVGHHHPCPQIKGLFEDVLKLSRFRYTVEEALQTVAGRIKSVDFDFAVTAIKLSRETGSDLPVLFEKTAKILRQRHWSSRQIGNVMFVSRIQSWVTASVIPLIILVSLSTSKNYQTALLKDSTGRTIFLASLFWWLFGVYLVIRSSRVKI